MKEVIQIITIFFFISNAVISQNPMLVQDYVLGSEGSIDGRIYQFKNTLIYTGVSQDGERALLQYDKHTDEIRVILKEVELGGTIDLILANSDEIYIFVEEGIITNKLYRARESNLSDLEMIYHSGDKGLVYFRQYNEDILITEFEIIDVEYSNNIKVIHSDGSITTLYEDLPFYPLGFRITAIKDHFVIAHSSDFIDGDYILAFNINTKEIVPFTDIIPAYQNCGFIQTFRTIPENVLYYACDENFIFDFTSDQFIEFNETIIFLCHVTDAHLYIANFDAYYKIDKTTNESEIILDNLSSLRGSFLDHIAFSKAGNFLDISYIDFEKEEIYTYPTDYPADSTYYFTGFGKVSSGIHTIIYDTESDNGIISRINSDSFTQIDSVYNVTFNNRPVAYDEDIYFTHQAPDVGNELFVIDYNTLSTNKVNSPKAVKVSPNPAMNYIQIQHERNASPVTTSILGIDGCLLKNNIDHYRVYIGDLNPGLYLLSSIYANGEFHVERFVKE